MEYFSFLSPVLIISSLIALFYWIVLLYRIGMIMAYEKASLAELRRISDLLSEQVASAKIN